MKLYQINKEKSLEIYNKCKDILTVKECYNNVFKICTEYMEKFVNKEWKIAYGYMRIFQNQNLFCRHCFILDNNDKVIDATLFTTSKEYKEEKYIDRDYFIMKTFDDMNEYTNKIMEENGYPALFGYLREQEVKMYEWANENGYMLCG